MVRPGRSGLALCAVGLATYAIALVVTMPAAVVLPGAQGTVWNGEMPLAANHRAQWRWSPLRSLLGLGVGVDWTIEGGDTRLVGGAIVGFSAITVEDAGGPADTALLFAYMPDLPFTCRSIGALRVAEARFGSGVARIEGSMRNGAGQCGGRGDEGEVAVPASLIEATAAPDGGTTVTLTAADGRGPPLLEGAVGADGGFSYRLSAEGARRLPFAASGAEQ